MLPAGRIILYFQLVGNATPQVLLAVPTFQDDAKTVCSKRDDVTKRPEEAQDELQSNELTQLSSSFSEAPVTWCLPDSGLLQTHVVKQFFLIDEYPAAVCVLWSLLL